MAARLQREHQRTAAPVPTPDPQLPDPDPSRLRHPSPTSSTAALDRPSASRHHHKYWPRCCVDGLSPHPCAGGVGQALAGTELAPTRDGPPTRGLELGGPDREPLRAASGSGKCRVRSHTFVMSGRVFVSVAAAALLASCGSVPSRDAKATKGITSAAIELGNGTGKGATTPSFAPSHHHDVNLHFSL